jgi:hypothetical protein
MISAAPIDGTSNDLCDWIELAVIANPDRRTLLSAVNLGLEMEEDFEADDLSQEGEERERRIQQVLAAMDERKESMPSAYPFALDDTASYVLLKDVVTDGGSAYLFCLVVSNAAKNGLLEGEGPWSPNLEAARDLFQACATIAAAGWVGGPAFSVGWPRLDGTSFLQKLSQVYSRFGDGKPHSTAPSWAPRSVKDDEIDVIAFRQEPDRRAGTLYLLGQAASGANWRTKSVKEAIGVYHKTWFIQEPSCEATAAMLMPFFLPSDGDCSADDHQSQEAIAGEFWRTVTKVGKLLYRNRIAHYIDVAVGLASKGITPIERLDALQAIRSYVDDYSKQLQAAVKALS